MQEEIAVGYRLSPQQKRLWKLRELDMRAPYRSQIAVLIEGPVDEERLTAALRAVVNRHEVLRTSYPCPFGVTIPVQTITATGLAQSSLNLSDLPGQEQSARVDRFLEEALRLPMDLQTGDTLRAAIIKLSPELNVLAITAHAITSDEIGLENLIKEALRFYGDPESITSLPEPLQYADYSEWQNQLLEADETRAGRDYWRGLEWRDLARLKLPFEKALEPQAGFEPRLFSKAIEPEIVAGISALAAGSEASIATVLLAGWHTLLWRITGAADLIVGARYEGRRFEGLGEAVGFFSKYLPVTCRLDDRQEFLDALKMVDRAARAAELWQESFAWEHLGDLHSAAEGMPFFPFLFDYKERELEDLGSGIGNLRFSIYGRYSCADRSKVRLSCVRNRTSLTAEFHFDPAFISTESARRLAGQYETLLRSVVRNPSAGIIELNLLSHQESGEIAEWNKTRADFPGELCAHNLFEQQARRAPDAIALEFQGAALTYRELDERANQLARHLLSLGVGPEVIVGICLDRSFDLVVSLLGVLKAGGAYLPLDASNPGPRLDYMVKDSGVRALITRSGLLDNFGPLDASAVCLDSLRDEIGSLSVLKPDSSAQPENLAYVIYTSGSTGNPKGVMIPHRGLVNYLSWCSRAYGIGEGVESVLHSPVGFDLSITSLHGPLAWGGKVVLVREGEGLQGLAEALKRPAPKKLLKLTPAHLEVMARTGAGMLEPGQEAVVVVGGEALMAESLKGWASEKVRVINEYGPTETVVGCCVYEVEQGERLKGSVPIGRPIENARMYILDRKQEGVAVGVTGEIYVAGEGVGRGYLGRAEQTAERFLPDPFAAEAGARMYRTGDMGRYMEGGRIEYLGRNDRQVKVKGFRVEPGEVEAELGKVKGVREVAVEVRESERGERELVGYVVTEEGVEEEEVRDGLKGMVPDYMVPTAIVKMAKMPLTHNGKIDRLALPAPARRPREPKSPFEAPHTQLEQAIAGVWRQALHVEEVGLNDNFFDLGGSSLVMFVVFSRLRESFVDDPAIQSLSMVDLFQFPTVGSLAKHLTRHQNEQPSFDPAQDRAVRQRAVRERQGRAVRARRSSND
ncbi:MAG TPA: amino acid adenylation domain-containing protein [Blastocatellia bacterium]|jgi:amino acid adenylation domain-containing protein|nr:amino acid adenylation domain-containing protein [Blastocatellia bacterium]